MPMTTTPDEIRQLSDEGLVRQAYALGLAPESVKPCDHVLFDFAAWRPWTPCTTAAQAEAVWRTLRRDGWTLEARSRSSGPPWRPTEGGCCRAWKQTATLMTWWSTASDRAADVQPTEARALVLCAVLALARVEREGPRT